MDPGRTVYRVTQLYVGGLFLAALLTAGWLFVPKARDSIQVAGVWFGLAGFGFLIGITLLLLSTER